MISKDPPKTEDRQENAVEEKPAAVAIQRGTLPRERRMPDYGEFKIIVKVSNSGTVYWKAVMLSIMCANLLPYLCFTRKFSRLDRATSKR